MYFAHKAASDYVVNTIIEYIQKFPYHGFWIFFVTELFSITNPAI